VARETGELLSHGRWLDDIGLAGVFIARCGIPLVCVVIARMMYIGCRPDVYGCDLRPTRPG
jgi:hypothetical protein